MRKMMMKLKLGLIVDDMLVKWFVGLFVGLYRGLIFYGELLGCVGMGG